MKIGADGIPIFELPTPPGEEEKVGQKKGKKGGQTVEKEEQPTLEPLELDVETMEAKIEG